MSFIPVPANNRNLGPAEAGVSWGLFAPSTIFIAARLYVRLVLRKNFGWDDFWIVLAWAFSLYICIFTQLAVNMGGGHHLYYVIQNLPHFQNMLKYMIMVEFGVVWGISLLKISVVAFVLRLINKLPNLRYIRWICYVDLFLFVPMTFALFLVVALQCRPLSAVWNEFAPADKCIGTRTLGNVITAYSSLSAASDLLTGILPVFILAGLQMEKSRQITACVLTGMGCIISATAIYKAVIAIKAFTSVDIPFDLVPISLECSIELGLGIIVACVPTLVPLFEKVGMMKEGRFSWLQSSRSGLNTSEAVSVSTRSNSTFMLKRPAIWSVQGSTGRRESDKTLVADDEEKATSSNSVIMQTIDIDIFGESDRESMGFDGNAEHPWLQVGKGPKTI